MQPGVDYIGVGVGGLIVNEKDETLLMKRGLKSRNLIGYWNRPGGIIEFGENSRNAICREIREEFGVEVEILGAFGTDETFLTEEKQHWVSIQYVCRITQGNPKNMEPDKVDEIGWFPLTKLPEPHHATLALWAETYLREKNRFWKN
ncbi:MAG: NUDIX domain-containing protein [Patescibacteria group bacterium]